MQPSKRFAIKRTKLLRSECAFVNIRRTPMPMSSKSRRPFGLIFSATAVLLSLSDVTPQAMAQNPPDSRPATFGVGGMVTPGVDSGFKAGWDLMAGGGFAVSGRSRHRNWRLYFT